MHEVELAPGQGAVHGLVPVVGLEQDAQCLVGNEDGAVQRVGRAAGVAQAHVPLRVRLPCQHLAARTDALGDEVAILVRQAAHALMDGGHVELHLWVNVIEDDVSCHPQTANHLTSHGNDAPRIGVGQRQALRDGGVHTGDCGLGHVARAAKHMNVRVGLAGNCCTRDEADGFACEVEEHVATHRVGDARGGGLNGAAVEVHRDHCLVAVTADAHAPCAADNGREVAVNGGILGNEVGKLARYHRRTSAEAAR